MDTGTVFGVRSSPSACKPAAHSSTAAAVKNAALEAIARTLEENTADILQANAEDLETAEKKGTSEALLDRLRLTGRPPREQLERGVGHPRAATSLVGCAGCVALGVTGRHVPRLLGRAQRDVGADDVEEVHETRQRGQRRTAPSDGAALPRRRSAP